MLTFGHVKRRIPADSKKKTPQLIKFGGKEERNGIAEELNGQYKAMMSSKYSKVRRCIQSGTTFSQLTDFTP